LSVCADLAQVALSLLDVIAGTFPAAKVSDSFTFEKLE